MDNATGFQSEIMKILLKHLKVKPIVIAAVHPSSNGSIKRLHATIKDQLKILVTDKPEIWPQHLKKVQFIFNNMINKGTGFVPLEAKYLKKSHLETRMPTLEFKSQDTARYINEFQENHLELLKQVKENLTKSKEKYEQEVTVRRKGPTPLYQIEDRIIVKNLQQTPLSKNWLGPYTITNMNTDTHTHTHTL